MEKKKMEPKKINVCIIIIRIRSEPNKTKNSKKAKIIIDFFLNIKKYIIHKARALSLREDGK